MTAPTVRPIAQVSLKPGPLGKPAHFDPREVTHGWEVLALAIDNTVDRHFIKTSYLTEHHNFFTARTIVFLQASITVTFFGGDSANTGNFFPQIPSHNTLITVLDHQICRHSTRLIGKIIEMIYTKKLGFSIVFLTLCEVEGIVARAINTGDPKIGDWLFPSLTAQKQYQKPQKTSLILAHTAKKES
jgi:hypothetical protein